MANLSRISSPDSEFPIKTTEYRTCGSRSLAPNDILETSKLFQVNASVLACVLQHQLSNVLGKSNEMHPLSIPGCGHPSRLW